jgi:hypothetical protein
LVAVADFRAEPRRHRIEEQGRLESHNRKCPRRAKQVSRSEDLLWCCQIGGSEQSRRSPCGAQTVSASSFGLKSAISFDDAAATASNKAASEAAAVE